MRVSHGRSHVIGIGQIDIADVGRIVRAARIQFLHEARIDLHARRTNRNRIVVGNAHDYRERIPRLIRGQFHDHPVSVDHLDMRIDLDEGHRGSFRHDDLDAVRQQTHDSSRLHPRNLLELFLSLLKWNKEDVAIDVARHDVKDLRARNIVHAGNADVVAGVEAKAPGLRAIMLQSKPDNSDDKGDGGNFQDHANAARGIAWQGSTANGNTLLAAQKWRLGLFIQVEHALVESRLVGAQRSSIGLSRPAFEFLVRDYR